MKDKEGGNRIIWIDSLKGIAICGVIMIHSGGVALPSILGRLGNIGQNGVQLFFVISAYLTYMSLEKLNEKSNKDLSFATIRKWWIYKFLKLIPLYYIAVLICIFIPGEGRYWLGGERQITLLNVVSHTLFLHGLIPHYINSIIGGEWYLADLAIFFLLAPVLYKYINSLEKAIMGVVLTMFGYSTISRLIPLNMPVCDTYVYEAYFGKFWFLRQIPIFLCGIALFFLIKEPVWDRIKSRKIMSYAVLLFSGIMIVGEMYGKNTLFSIKGDVRFSFWFCGIILSQTLYLNKLINLKVFRMLGQNSYPIYLFHYLLIGIYDKIVMPFTENIVLNWLVKFLIVTGGAYLLSLVLIRCVDRPIQTLILKMNSSKTNEINRKK